MRALLLLGSLVIAIASSVYAQSSSSWAAADPGFRAVNITATRSAFWVCGTGEGIATSTDGRAWQPKHRAEGGSGALLLGIGFASDTFGYAFGTGGTVLTTTDGGATWTPQKFGTETILQASFSDPTHGLVRTRNAVSYLNGDGTLHPLQEPADVLQHFPYTTVETDGTVQGVEVKNVSSPRLQKEVHDQVAQWLFEPPVQNGKPFRVTTNSTLNITVMRSK